MLAHTVAVLAPYPRDGAAPFRHFAHRHKYLFVVFVSAVADSLCPSTLLSRTTATGSGRVGMGPGRLLVVVVLCLLGYARERASLPAVLLAAAPSLLPDSKARPRAGPELTD